MKPILLSGIQPTGRLHIGNYLGALKNFVELQNSGKYDCHFFIADLHSLTEDFNPRVKSKQILELMSDYLAAGLDPKKSIIFQQSKIPAHSELAWILNTITSMGELRRMTQFKDKSMVAANHRLMERVPRIIKEGVLEDGVDIDPNVGLFDYPVLMAADILLYDTQVVPVGDDQDQHLELTRALARKFNSRFGKTFIEPKGLHTATPRVMSLANPLKKMSKSQPESCLFMDDEPKDIEAKIKRAVTDSETKIVHDPEKRPGISNLLEIYASLTEKSAEEIASKYENKGYAVFKVDLAKVIADHFADFRKKKTQLTKAPGRLESALSPGSKKAAQKANKKIEEVKKKIGLL